MGLPQCTQNIKKETQEALHHSAILQQTVCELYSMLGIYEGSQTGKIMGQNITNVTISKTNKEDKPRNPLKRKNPDDGQNGCKKPRVETMPSGTQSRKKTIYSNEQIKFLQNQFDCNPYPDFVSKCRISQVTGIPEPNIQVWFQNRRARYLSRRNQIPEKKKPTAQILIDVHEKLPSISMEDIWML
ncbi:homeobox protein siamois-like [Bufo bufo]|uniref:homeobox protein siamois-like n=2 Tax=Bufo bufo TaxID=8384 RepID=UPI001ABEB25D|nr:homeobox protein siamois-like [Bufo bufo]